MTLHTHNAVDRRRQSPGSSDLAPAGKHRDTTAVGRLSPRETEVMLHLASGKGHGECAHLMGIRVSSVRTHLRLARLKLGVSSTIEAMNALGWVDIP
jgi:DNA-binding CsgD family transcriptional regulator